MRRIFNVAAALIFVAITVQAQKIDTRLTSLLPVSNKVMNANHSSQNTVIDTIAVQREINVSFNKDCTVKNFSAIAMLREGAECPVSALKALDIEIRQQIGRMLILCVPAESLLALNDIGEIESVSADQMNQVMNNHGREKSKVSEVATAEMALSHNLPQAYTGKGVIVGIVDTGIDYNHAAFRNADGSTRVKMAVNYTAQGNTTTYTNATDIAKLETDNFVESHGTHVAATAAGSFVQGLEDTMLDKQGMAPEADLVLCGLGGAMYDSNIIDAIKKIFDYAKTQEKPCVVNCSMGNVGNFHDGTVSLVVKGLREFYKTESNKKGLVCVFSSGNSGGHNAIYTTVPAAGTDGYNLRTILGHSGEGRYNGKYVYRYSELNNFFYNYDGSDLDVDVKVVDVTTGQVYPYGTKEGEKSLYSVIDGDAINLLKDKGTEINNNKKYVRYTYGATCQFHEPNLKLAYFVKDTAGKVFRTIDKREDDLAGYYNKNVAEDDGGKVVAGEVLAGYTEGDSNGAFNIHTCSEQVIGVGSYVSEAKWTPLGASKPINYLDPTLQVNGGVTGYSSWGVDENGVNHPDVIAPGTAILSAYNIHDMTIFDDGMVMEDNANYMTDATTLFDRNHFYGVMSGTSMASPNVAGIVALWLQADPELTYADVRSIIKETSVNDEFTTNVENIPSKSLIQAGAGKINALMGLQKILGVTAIKTVEADGMRKATPATMYDVDDNCYNTLGQRVSKNAKGIVIYKGKVYMNN